MVTPCEGSASYHRLALTCTAGASIATLAWLARRVGARDVLAIDHPARAWMQRRTHKGVRHALHVAGYAGTAPAYLGTTALAATLVAKRGHVRRAGPLLGAVIAAVALHTGIKHTVCGTRPPGARARGNTKPSFPSGHTTRATAVTGTIAYVLMREDILNASVAVPLALSIPLTVGVSRAYADHHWTSDVVGGWGLGMAVAAACGLWYDVLVRRESPCP